MTMTSIACRWVTDEILNAPNLRSPLVAESVRGYQTGQRYPLSIVGEFSLARLQRVSSKGCA